MDRNTWTGQCPPGGKEIGWDNGDRGGFLVGMPLCDIGGRKVSSYDMGVS